MTTNPTLDYTDEAVMAGSARGWLGLSRAAWWQIGILAVLMVATFWSNLHRLWLKTNPFTGEANWGHAVAVPLIGLYYLYVHRDELRRASAQPAGGLPCALPTFLISRIVFWLVAIYVAGIGAIRAARFINGSDVSVTTLAEVGVSTVLAFAAIFGGIAYLRFWASRSYNRAKPVAQFLGMPFWRISPWDGVPIILVGLLLFAYGIYPGQNDMVKDIGLVATLFGVATLAAGVAIMRIAWFPILFLVCAIPWPELMYSKLALPLQKLAAWAAVAVLRATGVDAHYTGTQIIVDKGIDQLPRILNVAEACAGLRSLMTFVTVAAAVAFLSRRPLWQKLIITASAVPIAIFCNVMRVAGQGLLDHYVDERLSENFAHAFVGLIMLIPAFFLILLVGWVLDRLFIEEVDAKAAPARAGAPSKATGPKPKADDLVIEVHRTPAAKPVAGVTGEKDSAGPGRTQTGALRPAAAPAPSKSPLNNPAAARQGANSPLANRPPANRPAANSSAPPGVANPAAKPGAVSRQSTPPARPATTTAAPAKPDVAPTKPGTAPARPATSPSLPAAPTKAGTEPARPSGTQPQRIAAPTKPPASPAPSAATPLRPASTGQPAVTPGQRPTTPSQRPATPSPLPANPAPPTDTEGKQS